MTPEQCAYKQQYWVFWYQADHRYALPTVAFFLVAIILFSIAHVTASITPRSAKKSPIWWRPLAFLRFLSYKSWRIGGWNSQSLGVFLLGAAGLVFFLGKDFAHFPTLVSNPFSHSDDSWATSLLLAKHQRTQLWRVSTYCHTSRFHGSCVHAVPYHPWRQNKSHHTVHRYLP